MRASKPVDGYITGRAGAPYKVSSKITPMPVRLVDVSCTHTKTQFFSYLDYVPHCFAVKTFGEVFSGDGCLSVHVDREHGSPQIQGGHICQQ